MTVPTALHLVTVATHWCAGLHRMLHSADACGLAATVRGMGDSRWGDGFGLKLEVLRAAADALVAQERAGDVILFVDAFDVIFVPGTTAPGLLRAFAGMHADVLLAGERLCHPDPERAQEHRRILGPACGWSADLPRPFVNSGVILGRAGSVARVMAEGPRFGLAEDDQRWWTTVVLRNAPHAACGAGTRVAVDTEGSLIQCLAEVDPSDLSLEPDRRVAVSGRRPAVLHFNSIGSEAWQAAVFADLFPTAGGSASPD